MVSFLRLTKRKEVQPKVHVRTEDQVLPKEERNESLCSSHLLLKNLVSAT